MVIALIGATSYVGTFAVQHFLKIDPSIKLVVLGRNPTKLQSLLHYPNVIAAHAYKHGDSLQGLLAKTEACIDLSYESSGMPSRQVQRTITHIDNMITACAKENVSKVILVGSVAVYGIPITRYRWTDVPLPRQLPFADTVYARLKAIAEARAVRANRKHNTSLYLIRAGHILGAGSRHAQGIANGLLVQSATLLAGREAPSNATTVEGLCDTLLMLSHQTAGQGQTIVANHIDLDRITYAEIVCWMAEKIGIEPITVPLIAEQKNWRARFFGWLEANKSRLLVLQSYMGLSAGLVEKIKIKRFEYGGSIITRSSVQHDYDSFIHYYLSDRVSHTQNVCGSSIDPQTLNERLDGTWKWLQRSGYALPSLAYPQVSEPA